MDSSTHDSPARAGAAFDTDGTAESAGSAPRARHGIALSPGMAAGKALLYRPRQESPPAERAPEGGPSDLARERRRVQEAIASAAAELRDLARRTAAEIGDAEAGIFEAQALMLEDPTIAERAGELIEREGYTAEAALGQAAQEQAALLAAMPGPLWQARAADVRDAARRAVAQLRPESDREPSLLELIERAGAPVVVVAEDLAPSDTAQVRADQVVAIALARGSTTAHAAILARALRIPTVGGLGPALFEATVAGEMLLVDGSQGVVIFQPTAVDLEQAQAADRQQATAAAAARSRVAEWRFRAGRTSDGERIEVLARWIADEIFQRADQADQAVRAARLSKADLATDMVREFTELQGKMGGIYAREAGEPEAPPPERGDGRPLSSPSARRPREVAPQSRPRAVFRAVRDHLCR